MAKKIRVCVVCGADVPNYRNTSGGQHCSKTCQAAVEGYSNDWKNKMRQKVDGSTAWKPTALEPVIKIVSGEPVLILSDVHAPIHSAAWLFHAIRCAKAKGVRFVIINGDLIDANQISKYIGSYYRRGAQLENDFDAAEAILKILCTEFEKVYLLMGNHDMRLIKQFGGEVSVGKVFRMLGHFDNLVITARSFVDVNETVRVVHPRQYSKIRGALAQRLANRWGKSIVDGHEHHSAMSSSHDGRFQACAVACIADINNQDYVRNECTDFVEPMNGFAIIFGEYIHCFDKFTRWDLFGLPEFEEK